MVNAQLSDGRVPLAIAATMATPAEVEALVSAGALVLHGSEYEIVDHLENKSPTRAEVPQPRKLLEPAASVEPRHAGVHMSQAMALVMG